MYEGHENESHPGLIQPVGLPPRELPLHVRAIWTRFSKKRNPPMKKISVAIMLTSQDIPNSVPLDLNRIGNAIADRLKGLTTNEEVLAAFQMDLDVKDLRCDE